MAMTALGVSSSMNAAAATGSVATSGTYVITDPVTVTATWSAVYVKSGCPFENVIIYKDGVFWSPGYVGSVSGSSGRVIPGNTLSPGSHTIQMLYANSWNSKLGEYKYTSTSTSFTITAVDTTSTVSGTIWGQTYPRTGGIITAAIPGALVHDESGARSTMTDTYGHYTLVLPSGTIRTIFAEFHDFATKSKLTPALIGGQSYVVDITLPCQWKECRQPWELRTPALPLNPDETRVFIRDVNGDGITDSVNLFEDAALYRPDLIVEETDYLQNAWARPAPGTFWLEMQGYKFDGVSYLSGAAVSPEDVYPMVKSADAGCYYTSKALVLRWESDLTYGSTLTIPSNYYHSSFTISVTHLGIRTNPYSLLFCYNDGRYNSALDAINLISWPSYYGPSGWPATHGDGTDLQSQMNSKGYPNTVAYNGWGQCSMSSFSTRKDQAITFYGDFVLEVIGNNVLTGNQESLYWSTMGMNVFGYYIDNV